MTPINIPHLIAGALASGLLTLALLPLLRKMQTLQDERLARKEQKSHGA